MSMLTKRIETVAGLPLRALDRMSLWEFGRTGEADGKPVSAA